MLTELDAARQNSMELCRDLRISMELRGSRRNIAMIGKARRSIDQLVRAFGAQETRQSHQNSAEPLELGKTQWIMTELGDGID